MGLERFLLLSAVLFTIGLYGALSRRHIIAVLMSIEIMFNAVNLAFVALSRYITPAALRTGGPEASAADGLLAGQTFAVFVIVVAAAEVALGLALVITFFRHRDTTDVTDMSLLRR
jgi:NADH:ubiquinone oxidoreductase subunit K